MVWSLDLDDFGGRFCSQGPYPLLKKLNAILGRGRDEINWGTSTQASSGSSPHDRTRHFTTADPAVTTTTRSPRGMLQILFSASIILVTY